VLVEGEEDFIGVAFIDAFFEDFTFDATGENVVLIGDAGDGVGGTAAEGRVPPSSNAEFMPQLPGLSVDFIAF